MRVLQHLLKCNNRIGFKYCNIVRRIHHKIEPLANCVELEIAVPWGKVAGKLWGRQDVQPILSLHGWQDNAGSFDNLAPLLLEHASILAIDLPGHGLSSWLPPGAMYYEFVYVLLIERLRRHFGWEKVKFLSHSLGAQASFWYASMYASNTKFVIALDHLKLPSICIPDYYKMLTKSITKLFDIEALKTSSPSYLEEEIIEKWVAATRNSIDNDSCRILLKRGTTKKSDGTLTLNRDPRVKVLPVHTGFTHENLQTLAQLITCPYLVLRATNSNYFEDVKYFNDILQILKTHSKDLQFQEVSGTHHFHMTNAQATANAIKPFLEMYN